MAITRLDIENTLVKRCGKKMALVEMDVVASGSNDDLNDPIATALLDMGSQPVSLSDVADSDLTSVDPEEYPELFDRAELRLLESISGNLDMVNISVGPHKEELNQLAKQVEKAIDRLITKISRRYGDVNFIAGVLALDFQAKEDE